MFQIEYLWTYISPDDDAQVITVLDLKNIGLYSLVGEALEFVKLVSRTVSTHYVERCKKIIIINASMMFSAIWRVISPFVHENTAKKVLVLCPADMSKLLEYISVDQLPMEYGGCGDAVSLGSHDLELQYEAYVHALNIHDHRDRLEQDSMSGHVSKFLISNALNHSHNAPKFNAKSSICSPKRLPSSLSCVENFQVDVDITRVQYSEYSIEQEAKASTTPHSTPSSISSEPSVSLSDQFKAVTFSFASIARQLLPFNIVHQPSNSSSKPDRISVGTNSYATASAQSAYSTG